MVRIAVPHTGSICSTLTQFLVDANEREDVEVVLSQHRPTDANRCKIANEFMEESDHDYLLMVDSDMRPDIEVLDILEKYDKKIMTPIILAYEEGIPYPTITEWGEDDGQFIMATEPEEELAKVDGAGTACMFIHRKVFEEMEKPYFEFRKDDNGTLNTGEDYEFCIEAPYDVYVATDYLVGHKVEVDVANVAQMMNVALESDKSEVFTDAK